MMPPRTAEQRGQQARRSILRGSLDGRVASARPVRERPQAWAHRVGVAVLPEFFAVQTASSSVGLGVGFNAPPAGAVAGDMMVAHVVAYSDAAMTAPDGWALVRTDGGVHGNNNKAISRIYSRAHDGSGGGYGWSLPSSGVPMTAAVFTYRAASAVVAHAGQFQGGGVFDPPFDFTDVTAPSVSEPGIRLSLFSVGSYNSRTNGMTLPSPVTARYAVASGGFVDTAGGDEPSATGIRTASLASAATYRIGQSVVIA